MPKGIYKRTKPSPMKGKKYEKMRLAKMGEKNPRWNNGNSEYPNHVEFKKARLKILKKVKGKCEICGKPAKLVHHLNGDKSNHSLNNLIALCFDCHEPLHFKNDRSVRGRPTKYAMKYGRTLREIAQLFGVAISTIHFWNKNPEKREWLENKLKELEERSNK